MDIMVFTSSSQNNLTSIILDRNKFLQKYVVIEYVCVMWYYISVYMRKTLYIEVG